MATSPLIAIFLRAEELDDDPEWLRESKLKAREIVNSDEWTQLPSKFDIHEYHIMEEFGRSIEDPELRDNLLHAIRGSGAFGRFRYALDIFVLREAWFDFRAAEFERIAVEWLEENGIAYTREPGSDVA